MRARLVVLANLSASLFVIGGAAALDFRAGRGTPTAELCAAQWNRSINRRNRSFAEIPHFEVAVVTGWLAKDRFPGCGVLLLHRNGRAWFSFSSQLHSGRIDRWDLVSGQHWGFDSPEGGADAPNAIITAEGRVRLIEI